MAVEPYSDSEQIKVIIYKTVATHNDVISP